MSKHFPIVIKRAETLCEQEEAINFINLKYMEAFKTTPPLPQIIFTATQNARIVGTMAIDFSQDNKPLRLEKIYQFNHSKAPLPVERQKIVEYGRWIATVPNISGALTYLATIYAIECGKKYGWVEHTKVVHRLSLRLGIKFYQIHGAQLVLSNISETDKSFYLASPTLGFYMISLAQAKKALKDKVQNLVNAHKIDIFHPLIIKGIKKASS